MIFSSCDILEVRLHVLGVAYLESARCASNFNVRPMFRYLADEGISTSLNLRCDIRVYCNIFNSCSATLMKVFEVHSLRIFSAAVQKDGSRKEIGSRMENVFVDLLNA